MVYIFRLDALRYLVDQPAVPMLNQGPVDQPAVNKGSVDQPNGHLWMLNRDQATW